MKTLILLPDPERDIFKEDTPYNVTLVNQLFVIMKIFFDRPTLLQEKLVPGIRKNWKTTVYVNTTGMGIVDTNKIDMLFPQLKSKTREDKLNELFNEITLDIKKEQPHNHKKMLDFIQKYTNYSTNYKSHIDFNPSKEPHIIDYVTRNLFSMAFERFPGKKVIINLFNLQTKELKRYLITNYKKVGKMLGLTYPYPYPISIFVRYAMIKFRYAFRYNKKCIRSLSEEDQIKKLSPFVHDATHIPISNPMVKIMLDNFMLSDLSEDSSTIDNSKILDDLRQSPNPVVLQ